MSLTHPRRPFVAPFLSTRLTAPRSPRMSLTMVTRYNVISRRGSSHFWVHVYSTFFSTIKINLVAKIMQSAFFVLFFLSSTKKSPFLAVLTWFLILGKIEDDDHFWWRHRPPTAPPPIKYTSSCREYQRLSTEGKIVSKYCNISKTLGGSIHPTPLYHGGGMNLHVSPRVDNKNGTIRKQ